jgi:hypothetical protein
LFSGENFLRVFQPVFKHAKAGTAPVLSVTGLPVFRSGTFRDSMGWENTWEDIHMHQIVANFDVLRNSGTFADVPVRAGHPEIFGNPLKDLIGYFTGLRAASAVNPVDGVTYTYLLADLDILDVTAQTNIENGLWRNRSSEIGFYSANNGAEYWPVMAGVAYVDIPAVEGLNFSKFPGVGTQFSIISDDGIKEVGPVGDDKDNQGTVVPAQNHGAPPVQPAPAPAPTLFQFNLAGQPTTDYAAVQTHITELEKTNGELATFATETKKAGRVDFVKGLVRDNKILAAQEPALVEHATGLTDEQFAGFKAIYELAPTQPLLGQHQVAPGSGGTPEPKSPEDEQVESARRIYNRHVLSGMSAENLAKTDSGKFLQSKGLI